MRRNVRRNNNNNKNARNNRKFNRNSRINNRIGATVQSAIDKAINSRNLPVGMTLGNLPTTIPRSVRQISTNMSNMTLNYYRALLDPEIAQSMKYDVKLPNPLPVQSRSLHIRNSWTIKPNQAGKCLISWRPGFLLCSERARQIGRVVGKDLVQLAIDKYNQQGHQMALLDYQAQEAEYFYSQVTVNNDSSLNGEDTTQGRNNIFLPMKSVNLPIHKYRLVSAKLQLIYHGKRDDESGTITSGQYVGLLRPAANVEPKGYIRTQEGTQSQSHTMGSKLRQAWDYSNDMAQFQQFDNIQMLPFGSTKQILKNNTYNFLYYPLDDTAMQFSDIGTIAEHDTYHGAVQDITAQRINVTINSTFQYSQTYEVFEPNTGLAMQYNVVSQERPHNTIPTYLIALNNVTFDQNITSDLFTLVLYENYECIMGNEMNMLSTSHKPLIEPKKLQSVFGRMAEQVANNIDNVSKVLNDSNIKRTVGNYIRSNLNVDDTINLISL